MNVSLPSFEEQKKEIELSLSRTILTHLEQQKITYEQSQEMARFILDGIDKTHTPHELLGFLQMLAQKWPMFESTTGLYRLKVKDEVETNADLKQAQQELAQMKGAAS